MTAKEAAAKIKKTLEEVKDEGLKLLTVLDAVGENKTQQVITAYKQILNGELLVGSVTSSVELDKKQKSKIEEKVSKTVSKEIVFIYEINTSVKNGLEIMVGDNIVQFNSSWY